MRPVSTSRPVLASLLTLAALSTAWLVTSSAFAAELKVRVLSRDGKPVTDVVIVAQPQAGTPAASSAPRVKNATLNQANMKFVPEILVIQTGTSVTFPNSDSVAHQVYSFSEPKRFKLDLYRGSAAPPQLFDKPGVVVVGCNIHDSMIAYIYVTPTPYFAKSDATGAVTLKDLPPGSYDISVWHPRFKEPQNPIRQTITVSADTPATQELRLTRPMAPEPRAHAGHDY